MARALALCTIAAANQRRPNEGLGPGSGKGWEAGECFGTARCEAEADWPAERGGRAGREATVEAGQHGKGNVLALTRACRSCVAVGLRRASLGLAVGGWRLEEELARRMALCSRGEGSLGRGSLGRSGPSSNLGLGLARTQSRLRGWNWHGSRNGNGPCLVGLAGFFLALEDGTPKPKPKQAHAQAASCTLHGARAKHNQSSRHRRKGQSRLGVNKERIPDWTPFRCLSDGFEHAMRCSLCIPSPSSCWSLPPSQRRLLLRCSWRWQGSEQVTQWRKQAITSNVKCLEPQQRQQPPLVNTEPLCFIAATSAAASMPSELLRPGSDDGGPGNSLNPRCPLPAACRLAACICLG